MKTRSTGLTMKSMDFKIVELELVSWGIILMFDWKV
jgi:hypothetical protein